MKSGQVNFSNIINVLGQMQPFLTLLAFLIGLVLFIAGLYRMSKIGSNPRVTWAQVIGRLLAGVFLMSVRTTLNMFTTSALGQKAPLDFLAYSPPGSGQGAEIVRIAIIGVRVLGYFVFIWGLYLLSQAWAERHQVGPVITHIIGGLFCINIVLVLHGLGVLTGGVMQSTIVNLFG